MRIYWISHLFLMSDSEDFFPLSVLILLTLGLFWKGQSQLKCLLIWLFLKTSKQEVYIPPQLSLNSRAWCFIKEVFVEVKGGCLWVRKGLVIFLFLLKIPTPWIRWTNENLCFFPEKISFSGRNRMQMQLQEYRKGKRSRAHRYQ